MVEPIRIDVADRILTITLDRPGAMNAFTAQMMREMIAAFDRADEDDEVRAVIVTGSGDRAFCAGADLSAGGATFDYAKGPRWSDAGSPVGADGNVDWDHEGIRDGGGLLSLRIFQSNKPVIGAINGAAVGIGATMTLPMDFRLAADTARFGFVFARRGIVPEAASSWFLPRIVGLQQALEWVYSAEILTAEQALAGRLLRSVHEPDELLDVAQSLARSFVVGRSPVALALAKQLIYRNAAAQHPVDAHRADSLAMWHTSVGDGKEGVAAFLEKREPRFTGRASQLPEIF